MLALDIGHLMVTGEKPIPDAITAYAKDLATLHLEDMRRGVHEHLPFGQGEIEFGPVFEALDRSGFAGVASVELSRSSADAVETAQSAFRFVSEALRR
jgi:sugar phosphate isomerase/epimerase